MEPQTAQTQASPLNQSFSPSTVALTKAIGMAESGGKYSAQDATGDNGNSTGAYQMTPGFLQEWAPKAGVQYQAGMQLSPQQQDEIASNAVQTMSTTGDPNYPHLGKLTPAQIASAWNSGDPDAYTDPTYGKNNTYGSLENYVNKVGDFYNQEAQKNPQSGTVNTQVAGSPNQSQTADVSQSQGGQPGWLQALEGLGLGGVGLLAGAAKAPLEDAATGAVTGGVAGSILPGAGTLAGAGSGALAGLTEGIIQDVSGGAGGAGGAGGGGAGGAGQTPAGAAAQPPEEQPQIPQIPQASAASQAVQNAINETLQGTQSNRAFSQSANGKEAINTVSQFGLIQPDENGNLTFNDEKSQQLEKELGQALDGQIKSQGGYASPVSVSNYGGQYIGHERVPTSDRQKASQIMQDEMKADSQGVSMNGQMSLSDMRERQKEHYAAAQNAYKESNRSVTPKMLAHKALGNAYGRVIRDNLPDKELYDRTKKMQANLINAHAVGKRLQGKRAPVHTHPLWESIVRRAALGAESYIGDVIGGPIGGVISTVAGDWLNGKIGKHFGQNIFETKGMKAALDTLRDTRPKEYEKIVTALKKKGIPVPKDEAKKPGTKAGLVKVVEQDQSRFQGKAGKGNKGLLPTPPGTDTEIPRPGQPKATLSNVDYGFGVPPPGNQSTSKNDVMNDTFKKINDWYERTGDKEGIKVLGKLMDKYKEKGLSSEELDAINKEYEASKPSSNALKENMTSVRHPMARQVVSHGLIDMFDNMAKRQETSEARPTVDVDTLLQGMPNDERMQSIEAMVQKGVSRAEATGRVTSKGLMDSMNAKGFDFKQPVKVRKNSDGSYEIIDGMNRLAVAKALGIKNIPIEVVE